ncbi:cytochrome b/b6 domain-containing protein [Lichenihabitans sp. PAMC28606]|uniref:cytochrome b n=1 Tax=Lichenihabitans sp. PAMC28606 TaxID=2880932 RepID=UPI001D0A1234|nr:cytochrome b/b6 domain-containing protein [Lichenihabitans sp. PAMC28606]UDL96269.1 cytochrome b/b6 domain-containing protein [Lichenihabitans sp. PAMC28606]
MTSGPLAGRGRHRPEAYTWVQATMHWIVVALLIAQYSTSGAIVRTHSMHTIGQKQNPTDLLLHVLHNRVGLLLTAVMIARLAYRLWAGVPAPAGHGKGAATARLTGLVHAAFYVVLIAEGFTGAVASYFWWPVSAVHVVLFKVLLGLMAAHVAAALWHQFVLRDAALQRIGVRWPFR